MDKSAENKAESKTPRRFGKVLNVLSIVIPAIMLAVAATVFYQRVYLEPFWVNGKSMWPTLNEHALDANGNEIGKLGPSTDVGFTVDYGVMNPHKGAIKRTKRFNVVVTQYPGDSTGAKIKRVLGLPGETIKFNVGGEHNGDLYINGKYVEQPISTELIREGNYPSGEIVLGSDEYYVVGDNRAHSNDSRSVGPIRRDLIQGRVVAICGKATVYRTDKGTFDVKNIKYSWPRRVK